MYPSLISPALLLLLLGGCGPASVDSTDPDPSTGGTDPVPELTFVGEPVLEVPVSEIVGLVAVLRLETTVPARLELLLEGGDTTREVGFEVEATVHEVPVLGLRPDTDYQLSARLTGSEGQLLELEPIPFTSGGLPERYPEVEVLVHEPDRMEPGYRLVTLKRDTDKTVLLVLYDRDMEPVWWYQADALTDVRRSPRGTLVGVMSGSGVEFDLLGAIHRRYTRTPKETYDVKIPWEPLHHELFEADDGSFWSLVYATYEVDAYPVDYEEPEVLGGPTEIRDVDVVHFGPQGEDLGSFSLSDVLDTQRIGYGSLGLTDRGMDWCHANAIVVDPTDGNLVVSSRHQDAAFKLTPSGELVWILGDPGGWTGEWADKLLTPVDGKTSWPYHQHGVMVTDDGTVLMFDNGNYGATPYGEGRVEEDEAEDTFSRAVAYRVSEEHRTVKQLWDFSETSTGTLFSSAVGDADPLPTTGNVLVDFGMLEREGNIDNKRRGRGLLSARLVELVPGGHGDVVLDVSFFALEEDEPDGYRSYRVEWIEDLYP